MSQDMSSIVDVTVTVSAASSSAPNFDMGLIVGTSSIITTADRTAVYTSPDAMKTAGWAGTEPEYLAAQLYFSQSPRPTSLVVGRWDSAGETLTAALTACRQDNINWYGCYLAISGGATDQNITDAAAFIESTETASALFYDTEEANILTATTPNIMDTLKKANRRRSIGMYSTTAYAGAALLGRAAGLNTGLANSAFTLAYKTLSGVTVDNLNTTQLDNIKKYNGNAYVNYGGRYDLFVKGVMANGTHFDEVLNLDQLVSQIQIAVMNLLTSVAKIPQTDDGVAMMGNAIVPVCESARIRGAIAPGIWKREPILNLNTGDALPTGYVVLAETIASQSVADIAARKAPPIYVPVKLAGAIEFVVIGVVVDQ
ncbi:DUF3383 domain-containing protein [Paenibacillus sp. P26]|nr:DUF3383 domain-containing protein [Paenibacillus sp. P26]